MESEFAEVHELLQTGDYDRVIYPSDAAGLWPGSSQHNIFTVGPTVIAEIMKHLEKLKQFPKNGKGVISFFHRFKTNLRNSCLKTSLTNEMTSFTYCKWHTSAS